MTTPSPVRVQTTSRVVYNIVLARLIIGVRDAKAEAMAAINADCPSALGDYDATMFALEEAPTIAAGIARQALKSQLDRALHKGKVFIEALEFAKEQKMWESCAGDEGGAYAVLLENFDKFHTSQLSFIEDLIGLIKGNLLSADSKDPG